MGGGELSDSRFGRITPRGYRPLFPLHKGLGGSQSGSGRREEEDNLLPLPGIELRFFGCQTHNLLTILTELSRLRVCHVVEIPITFPLYCTDPSGDQIPSLTCSVEPLLNEI
jgi:hypothetical protein